MVSLSVVTFCGCETVLPVSEEQTWRLHTLVKYANELSDLGHTHTHTHDVSFPSHLWPTAFWCWWFWRRTLGPCRVWHSAAPLKRPPWETKTGDGLDAVESLVSIKRGVSAITVTSSLLSAWSECLMWIWGSEESRQAHKPTYNTVKQKNKTVYNLQNFSWATSLYSMT